MRLVPTFLSRKEVLFFDGIRYSLHIFDLAASRLAHELAELSKASPSTEILADAIAAAISDAWLLIDSVHRLRELLGQAPRLKKNQPALQLFLRRTVRVESLRHFFQHFRSEIDAFASIGLPLWGALSWIFTNPETGETSNFIIAPGTFFEGAAVPTCTFDTLHRKYVERVVLYAGPTTLDLASLAEHVSQLATWYTNWFQETVTGNDRHAADLHIRISVKLVEHSPDTSNRPRDSSNDSEP